MTDSTNPWAESGGDQEAKTAGDEASSNPWGATSEQAEEGKEVSSNPWGGGRFGWGRPGG